MRNIYLKDVKIIPKEGKINSERVIGGLIDEVWNGEISITFFRSNAEIDTSNLSDDELNSEMDKKQSELKALLEERK